MTLENKTGKVERGCFVERGNLFGLSKVFLTLMVDALCNNRYGQLVSRKLKSYTQFSVIFLILN